MKRNRIKQINSIRVFVIIILVIITQTLISCAKIGTPSGGAYDRTPPKLEAASPNLILLILKERNLRLSLMSILY